MGNRFASDAHLVGLRRNLGDVQTLMGRGVLVESDTGRSYFTGYSYKTLYDWDQYFEAIVQIYMGWPTDYIKNGVTIFLDHQRETGLISRSVPSNEHHDPEHVKPFLAQIALLVEKTSGERDWIVAEPYFSRLKRYLDYWLIEMDGDGNGLSEWMSAPHTGMDNQHERAGYWGDRLSEGVDLNCYLVREMQAFAALARLLGRLLLDEVLTLLGLDVPAQEDAEFLLEAVHGDAILGSEDFHAEAKPGARVAPAYLRLGEHLISSVLVGDVDAGVVLGGGDGVVDAVLILKLAHGWLVRPFEATNVPLN